MGRLPLASRVLLAVGAIACTQPPAPIAADADAYLKAASGDPAACATIADPALASECGTFAAERLAAVDLPAARATCESLADPFWRDECGFLVCDTAKVSPADARTCCAGAGRYETRCLGHAVSRAVYAELEKFGPGEEQAALVAARAVSTDALGPAGVARATDLFVRFLVDRSDGTWLRAEDCGQAPVALCSDAYAELVAKVAGDKQVDAARFVRSACARTVSVERATGLGLPGWDAVLDDAVQQAFSRMCAR